MYFQKILPNERNIFLLSSRKNYDEYKIPRQTFKTVHIPPKDKPVFKMTLLHIY